MDRPRGRSLELSYESLNQTNCKHSYDFLGAYINSCGALGPPARAGESVCACRRAARRFLWELLSVGGAINLRR